MDDYLHQPYRMGLLSFAQPLLTTLRESGAAVRVGPVPAPPCGAATSDKAEGVAARRKRFSTTRASPESCTCSKRPDRPGDELIEETTRRLKR